MRVCASWPNPDGDAGSRVGGGCASTAIVLSGLVGFCGRHPTILNSILGGKIFDERQCRVKPSRAARWTSLSSLSAFVLHERENPQAGWRAGGNRSLVFSCRTAWMVQPSLKSTATMGVTQLPCNWSDWRAGRSCSLPCAYPSCLAPWVEGCFVFLWYPSAGMWINLLLTSPSALGLEVPLDAGRRGSQRGAAGLVFQES